MKKMLRLQAVTVVLTVPADDARLARSVAIRWHRAREGMQKKTGTPPADGATTITYNFVADVRGSEDGPSAGRRACAAARHGVDFNVPRSDDREPTGDSRAGTTVRRAVGLPRGSRGNVASVEAQIMADCPVIYYDDEAEYDGGPPVRRYLRWVAGICGPRDPDMH